MRPRIRTIKPEFFLHEQLAEADVETGLPLRLSYIGLWCHADREGRFEWRPKRLKIQILPYDDHDFSRVLDALMSRGYLVHYMWRSKEYGWIRSFKDHQAVNNKEPQSELPSWNDEESEVLSTQDVSRVDYASCSRDNLDQVDREWDRDRERIGNGNSMPTPSEVGPAPDPAPPAKPRPEFNDPGLAAKKAASIAALKASASPKPKDHATSPETARQGELIPVADSSPQKEPAPLHGDSKPSPKDVLTAWDAAYLREHGCVYARTAGASEAKSASQIIAAVKKTGGDWERIPRAIDAALRDPWCRDKGFKVFAGQFAKFDAAGKGGGISWLERKIIEAEAEEARQRSIAQ